MNLEEIRKYFRENKSYVIKIREKTKDIVYYDGIKIMEIKNKNKYPRINLSPDIFQINEKLIKSVNNNSSGIEKIIKIRNFVEGLFDIKTKFDSNKENIIILNESDKYDSKTKEENLKKILYGLFKNEDINNNFDYIENYRSKGRGYHKEKKVLKYKGNISLEELTKLEYEIVKTFIESEGTGWTKPDVKLYSFREIEISDLKKNKEGKLVLAKGKNEKEIATKGKNEKEITTDNIKNAILEYEKISFEEEKYYQHQFMIHDNINKKCQEFKNIFRFEEEYYTKEGKTASKDKTKRGRIDNIFVDISKDGSASLYLIELKYGTNVLGGKQGIHCHLHDMKDLLSNESKKEKFLNLLKDRINYRIETSIDDINTPNKITNIKDINFYIVIGYSNEEEKEEISNILKEFNGNYSYCKKCNCYKDVIKHYDLPKESKELKEEFKDLDKYCNVKIFLDKTNYQNNEGAKKIEITDKEFEKFDIE